MTDEPESISYPEWMALAEAEYTRLDTLLGALTEEDWLRPTDCTGWDVRTVVSHLVGAAEGNARMREMVRQSVKAIRSRDRGDLVDRINAVQVAERRAVDGPRLRHDLRSAGRRGVASRRRLPGMVRAVPVPWGPPLGVRSVGYLMGRIYTRDAWMHRLDIARAIGAEPELTAAHDGRIVADVVHEWATTHGRGFRLRLTGSAGGTWGGTGEELTLDAVEFCRTVSGRAPGSGLLATPVPF